jgi:hypothetical protein
VGMQAIPPDQPSRTLTTMASTGDRDVDGVQRSVDPFLHSATILSVIHEVVSLNIDAP